MTLRQPVNRQIAVGLDPSWTGFGAALYDPASGKHYTGVAKTTGTKGVPVGYRRIRLMHNRLMDVFANGMQALQCGWSDVSMICLEDFARGAINGREESGMVRSVTLDFLGEMFGDTKVAYPTLVATTALKKYVLGSGRGEKSDMKMATYKKWGVEFKNDNECDAYGLARIAAALGNTSDVALAYEREVLANLGRHGGWEPH